MLCRAIGGVLCPRRLQSRKVIGPTNTLTGFEALIDNAAQAGNDRE